MLSISIESNNRESTVTHNGNQQSAFQANVNNEETFQQAGQSSQSMFYSLITQYYSFLI